MTSDSVLLRIIDSRIRHLGIKQYHFEAIAVSIDTPQKDIDFKNDLMFLVSETIDLPYTTKIIFQSPDNLFITSSAEYKTLSYSKYRNFIDHLNITVSNYGSTFVPFQLEFIRIIPETE